MVSESSDPRFSKALRPFLLGVRPPQPGSSRVTQLRFVRDLQVRSLLVSFPLCLIVILVVGKWWALIVLAALLLLLSDIVYLTVILAREASADRGSSP